MLLRTRSCKTNSCYVVLIRKLRWGRPLLLTSTQASRTHVAHSCDTPSPTHGKVTPKKAILSSPAGRHPTLAQSGWCTGTDRPLSPPLCLCTQLHRIYSETASEVGRGRCGGSVGPQGVCRCPPAGLGDAGEQAGCPCRSQHTGRSAHSDCYVTVVIT